MMLAVFAVAALSLGASASGICPNGLSGSGYVMGSSCYEFVAKEMTWVNALSHCHSRGGRLASVTSADLQRWISSQAATLFKGYQGVWIGLNDRKNEGSFVWDNYDGRPDVAAGGYTNWKRGEPDDGIFGQDCVYMRRSYNWRWDDLECNLPYFREYNFICEYSVVSSTAPSTSSGPTTVASSSSSSGGSLVTTVYPPIISVTNANATAGNALTTGTPSSTLAATVRQTASEQLSSPFRVTSEVATQSSTMATTETVAHASSITDAEISLRTSIQSSTSTLISLSTSIDSNLQTNAATTESEASTRTPETTVSILWSSPNSSGRTRATELGHASVYEARNSTEADASAVETHLASSLHANAATAESEASTRATETTVSILWQSPNSSERTRAAEPGHAAVYEARNSIEANASADETHLASSLHANAANVESAASTHSSETTVSIHWQWPSSSEGTRTTESGHAAVYEEKNSIKANAAADATYLASTAGQPGEPGARHVASQESTYNTDMPIYLSVIAIALLGAIVAIAVLGYKIHKRRQQRPVAGIENPLYGAAQRPRPTI